MRISIRDIAPDGKINHELVNLGYSCDVKSGLIRVISFDIFYFQTVPTNGLDHKF